MKTKFIVNALMAALVMGAASTNVQAAERSARASLLAPRANAAAPVASTAPAQPTSYDKTALLALAADKPLAADFLTKAFEGTFTVAMTADGKIELSQPGKPTILMDAPAPTKLSPTRIGNGGITAKANWINTLGLRMYFFAPNGKSLIHNDQGGPANYIFFVTEEELSTAKKAKKGEIAANK